MRLVLATPLQASLGFASAPPRARPPLCVRDDLDERLTPPGFDRTAFTFGTVEQRDLPAVINVLMDGFYKDRLTLAKDEFSEEEMEKLRPALSIFNDGFKKLTRAFLSFETNRRLLPRLPRGGLERGSQKDALMLALQDKQSGTIVAVAELSQQPCDGKVPGDLRLPSLPWARDRQAPLVAYICNLAVLKPWRGQGLGTSLLRALEGVASSRWGFNEVYLHAATKEDRLLGMYEHQGYTQLPELDQPDWVLAFSGREATRFHRKPLPKA